MLASYDVAYGRRAPQLVLPQDAEVVPAVDPSTIGHACEPSEEPCSICLDTGVNLALPCGHAFHRACLTQWMMDRRPTCPNCGRGYGPRIGDMPDGEMRWLRSSTTLAGHTCGTVVLHFNFPAGEAGGVLYAGRSQHAYLPDNDEGRQLLAAFALAFRRRVLFGLGQSMTTGQTRPTFAIHLKTATGGGPTRHGFPDPDYFENASRELRAADIVVAEAPSVDLGPPPLPAQLMLAIGITTRLVCVYQWVISGCILMSAFSAQGRDILLPILAWFSAICNPDRPFTLPIVTCCLAAQQRGGRVTSTASIVAALLYALASQIALMRGYDRIFLLVKRYTRRFLLRLLGRGGFSSIQSAVLVVLLAAVGQASDSIVSLGVPAVALGCMHDLLCRRCQRQRRGLHRRGRPAAAEPLLNAQQPLGNVLAVPAALAAAAPPRRAAAPRAVASAATPLADRSEGQATQSDEAPESADMDQPGDGTLVEDGQGQVQRDLDFRSPSRVGCMTEDDWAMYTDCPSLRGRPDAPSLHARLTATASELDRSRVHNAVREMMHNELQFGEDYAVFYHSYSASCLLYEVQTALACLLLGYPEGGPPVIRLSREPFLEADSLVELLAMHRERRSDHHEGFRNVAISAVVSWFASGGYGHSLLMRHFIKGWFSGFDLGDMTVLLEELLRSCGLTGQQLEGLVEDILEVGDKWGLEMSRYKDRGRRRTRAAATCPGHILQIFVHSSVVDAVAYGALPLGRLASNGSPISAWLAQQCPLDGQARLLVHPDLFVTGVGRDLVRVFTFSGSPMFGRPQRQRLLHDLQGLLAPHFASQQARGLAHAGLGFDMPEVSAADFARPLNFPDAVREDSPAAGQPAPGRQLTPAEREAAAALRERHERFLAGVDGDLVRADALPEGSGSGPGGAAGSSSLGQS